MHASNARKATIDARTVDMSSVYRKIELAATSGQESIQVQVGSWKTNNSVDNVIADLKANGYTVKREQGYDQRDGEGWDYLIISW